MNKKEMIQHMINGKTLVRNDGAIAYFDGAYDYCFRFKKGELEERLRSWDSGWKIKEEWYEDIPEQGILCRVVNCCGNTEITLIIKYHENKGYYDNGVRYYKDAQPLTKEEVMKYIYNG